MSIGNFPAIGQIIKRDNNCIAIMPIRHLARQMVRVGEVDELLNALDFIGARYVFDLPRSHRAIAPLDGVFAEAHEKRAQEDAGYEHDAHRQD
jgi:hypothetical protein